MAIFFRITATAHAYAKHKRLQTTSVLLMLSFFLRNGSYSWHIYTGKKLWLLIVWPPRLNNYTSNNLCFSFKENVFSPQRPLYQESTLSYICYTGPGHHNQRALGTSLSSAILTGIHSKETDHVYTLQEGRRDNSYLIITPKSQNPFQDVAHACDYLKAPQVILTAPSLEVTISTYHRTCHLWMNYQIN